MPTYLPILVSLSLLFSLYQQALAQQPKPIKEIFEVPLGTGGGAAFVMSPDGKWFGVGSKEHVAIHSLPDGKVLHTIPYSGPLKLALSPEGNWLAVTTTNVLNVTCQTQLFDTKTWQEFKKLEHHRRWGWQPEATALSGDGKYLSLAKVRESANETRHEVIEVSSGKSVVDRHVKSGRVDFPVRLRFSADDKQIAMIWEPIQLVDIASGEVKTIKDFRATDEVVPNHTDWYSKLGLIAVAASGGKIMLISDSTGEVKSSFTPFEAPDVYKQPTTGNVHIVGLIGDGKQMVVGGAFSLATIATIPTDKKVSWIRLYDSKGKILAAMQPGGRLEGFATSRDGKYFMTYVHTHHSDRVAGVHVYQNPTVK
jgi:hypothetical protein